MFTEGNEQFQEGDHSDWEPLRPGEIVEEPKPPKPDSAELLRQPEIARNIFESSAATNQDLRERTFIASFSVLGQPIVNKPYTGHEHGVMTHMPALRKDEHIHPEGVGLHLEPGAHPYFCFHTHPGSESFGSLPSLRDIGFLFRTARQNFILTPAGRDHWFNPLGLIVAPKIGRAFAFQFSPETVTRNSEEQLTDQYAEICVGLMFRLKDPMTLQIEKETPGYFQDFPQDILVSHLSEKEIVLEIPRRLFTRQAEILRRLGAKVRQFRIDKSIDIAKKLKGFEVVPEIKD